jgi:hypothetical protein
MGRKSVSDRTKPLIGVPEAASSWIEDELTLPKACVGPPDSLKIWVSARSGGWFGGMTLIRLRGVDPLVETVKKAGRPLVTSAIDTLIV